MNRKNRSVEPCHTLIWPSAAGQISKIVATANIPPSDRSAMIRLCVTVADIPGGSFIFANPRTTIRMVRRRSAALFFTLSAALPSGHSQVSPASDVFSPSRPTRLAPVETSIVAPLPKARGLGKPSWPRRRRQPRCRANWRCFGPVTKYGSRSAPCDCQHTCNSSRRRSGVKSGAEGPFRLPCSTSRWRQLAKIVC